MYIRNEVVNTHTFEHEKTHTFPVGGNTACYFTVDARWSLELFMDKFKQHPEV
ncbi:hypothetical protein HOY80DRAFT_952773 [Tuber brumale]|nr:hypothetical protein HOY80DRAFT_952773 [Tuber brumale]